jgi:molecular chaperone GrpE (heat shock protein)
MNNATDDLKALYISNLNTIKELNNRVKKLELEKDIQNISDLDTIRELTVRVGQLEAEKDNQNSVNFNTISELSNRAVQLESEKSIQYMQLSTGLITFMDTFEKLKKAISKKALNKTDKGKKVLDRYKKVRKSFKELLLQFEITEIKFPDNQMIAGFCKVVGTEPDADKPDDTILSIVKNGYTHGTELIREAEVIVVKNHQEDQTEISDAGLNHSI